MADDNMNMYFPEANNNRPSSKSITSSLRSKKAKAMSSLPAIGRRDSEDGSGNAQTVKRHRGSSKRLSLKSHHKSNSSINREMNSSFASKGHHMTTFDNNASKSLDRNMGNAKMDAKQTIMTAHEPDYARQKLDLVNSNRKDMTQWNDKNRSQMTSHQNIRISTG